MEKAVPIDPRLIGNLMCSYNLLFSLLATQIEYLNDLKTLLIVELILFLILELIYSKLEVYNLPVFAHLRDDSLSLWTSILIPFFLVKYGNLEMATYIFTAALTCNSLLLTEASPKLAGIVHINILFIFANFTISIPSIFFLCLICDNLLRAYPKAFSFPEALVLSQLITLGLLTSNIFACFFIMFSIVHYFKVPINSFTFGLFLALTASLLTPKLYQYLLLLNGNQIFLLRTWLAIVVLLGAFLILMLFVDMETKLRKIGARKVFHFILVAIYSVGIKVDIGFLADVSYVVLIGLLTMQWVINDSSSGLSCDLNYLLRRYADSRDPTDLLFTPMTLFLGFCLPIWLTMFCLPLDKVKTASCIWSGLLGIGIGDSFASIVGVATNSFRLPYTQKTYAGTFASLISQIIFWCYLCQGVQASLFLPGLLAIFMGTIVEAYIHHIDNLFIPLVMMLFMPIA